jgi:hypothetical protein
MLCPDTFLKLEKEGCAYRFQTDIDLKIGMPILRRISGSPAPIQ